MAKLRIVLVKETAHWTINLNTEDVRLVDVEYSWGTHDGATQFNKVKFTKGVNVGKSNETVALQQAFIEIGRKINRRLIDGYALRDGEADIFHQVTEDSGWDDLGKADMIFDCLQNLVASFKTLEAPRPMLAKPKFKLNAKTSQLWIQPKFDGFRCLADADGEAMFSRTGERFETMQHIEQAIKQLGDALPSEIEYLDGELYCHEFPNPGRFEAISSIVRNKSEDKGRLQIYYCVYDCITTSPMTYAQRIELLHQLFSKYDGQQLRMAPTVNVVVEQTVSGKAAVERRIDAMHDHYVALGYEGGIVRLDGVYKPGPTRSSDLWKVKKFSQEEFEIVGVNREKHQETLGTFTLRNKDGDGTFDSTPAMTDVQKLQIWNERHTYDWTKYRATVKLQELHKDGTPRIAHVLGLRPLFDIGE